MVRWTKQEQWVIALMVSLLLVGLAVRYARTTHSMPPSVVQQN